MDRNVIWMLYYTGKGVVCFSSSYCHLCMLICYFLSVTDDEFSSAKCSKEQNAQQQKGAGGNCGGPSTSANLNHRHQGPSSVTARGKTTTTNVKREKRSLEDPTTTSSNGASSSYPPAKKTVQHHHHQMKKEEEDMFPDDDDDYIFHTAASAFVQQKEEEEEENVFPDDDDDILFTDMSESPTVSTEETTEQQQQLGPTIERPFTYLSRHIDKRANNAKCQEEYICVKVTTTTTTTTNAINVNYLACFSLYRVTCLLSPVNCQQWNRTWVSLIGNFPPLSTMDQPEWKSISVQK